MIFFLLTLAVSAASASSFSMPSSYALDQDLVQEVKQHLEPTLYPFFLNLQDLYKQRASKSDLEGLENYILLATRNGRARTLLELIPTSGEGNARSFGNMARHGYGDKYRMLLALAQQRNELQRLECQSPLTFSFTEHYRQWLLADALVHNLMLSRELFHGTKSPVRVLEDLTFRMLMEAEEMMGRLSDPMVFLRNMRRATYGLIFSLERDSISESSPSINELFLLLDPLALSKLLGTSSPQQRFAAVIGKIAHPIRREYFKQALLHWQQFQVSNQKLTEQSPELSLDPTNCKLADGVEAMLRCRMDVLRNALPRIFTWDQRVSSRQLHASWCLVQYLKYTSRLLLANNLNNKTKKNEATLRLRGELQALVLEYADKVEVFRDHVAAQIRIRQRIDSAPGLCRFSKGGAAIRNILLMSAPLPFGGQPHYHVCPIQVQHDGDTLDDDCEVVLVEPEVETWTDLLLVVSEPAFDQPVLLEQFIGEVISAFSAHQ